MTIQARRWPILFAVTTALAMGALAIAALAAGHRRGAITVSTGSRTSDADTLNAAFGIARQLRHDDPGAAIVIQLPPGLVRLSNPVKLTAADSGTAAAPLVLRGAPDGSTVLTGAAILDAAPVGKRRYDLAKIGNATPFAVEAFGSGSVPPRTPLLFRGDHRLPIARWPVRGYASGWKTVAAPGSVTLTPASGTLPRLQGRPWMEGYFTQDWLFEAVSVERATGGAALIVSTGSGRPSGVRDNARLSLVDDPAFLHADSFVLQPGQTTVDVLAGASADGPLEAAVADTLLDLDGVEHMRIADLSLIKTRVTPVVVQRATDIAFTDCLIGHAGQYGIDVRGSKGVTLSRCTITDTGSSAVSMEGGDRSRLEGAGLGVVDSIVTDAAFQVRTAPAIVLWGVGNSIRGSRVESLPGPAIALHGNDHLVADNVIGKAVCEMSDAGAIYMGRSWTERGMRIARNFIHDIGDPRTKPLVSGVYLDDQFSGAEIANNILLRMAHGVFVGGGRDNRIDGNVFAQIGNSAIYLDARGRTWQQALAGADGSLRLELARLPIQGDLWRRRYPALAVLLQDHSGDPAGNLATDNAYVQAQLLWTAPLGLSLTTTGVRVAALSPLDAMRLGEAPEEAYRVLHRFAMLPATLSAHGAGPRWSHPTPLAKDCAD